MTKTNSWELVLTSWHIGMNMESTDVCNAENVQRIKLLSNSGKLFFLSKESAMMSETIKDLVTTLGETTDEEEIPLPNVDDETLEKICDWLSYHKDDPPVPDYDNMTEVRTDDISEWDENFLGEDVATIIKITEASNYLHIKGLLALCCKTLANMVKGKTAQQIRDLFGLENDFTPEEEENIRLENQWIEEFHPYWE